MTNAIPQSAAVSPTREEIAAAQPEALKALLAGPLSQGAIEVTIVGDVSVEDAAAQIDDRVGAQYGDYARKASRTLQETSAKLDSKSVEELGEDARAMVRKSPGVAVGVAAVFGFFLARLLGGSKR